MATVLSVEIRRGVAEIRTDESDLTRVSEKHFRLRPVKQGDAIEMASYLGSVAALQFNEAYEAALRSLDVCSRTERELKLSLLRKGYVEPCAQAVLERLRHSGLVDDRRYAGRVVEIASNRPMGAFAVKRKLRMKGISDADAESALELLDEEQQLAAARESAKALYRKYAGLPAREGRAKLSQALARRGFGWDAVRQAVEELFLEDDWE